MRVFKGFFIVLRQNLYLVLLYLGIFLGIFLAFQAANQGKDPVSFTPERLQVAVIDRDGSSLSKGLSEYLGNYQDLVDIEDDPAVIQEELFYRNVYYVVIIPENFGTQGFENHESLETMAVLGSIQSYYVQQQINGYFNGVRVLEEGGFSREEAVEHVLETTEVSAEVVLEDQSGYGGEWPGFAYMFRYLPYVMLAVCSYCMSYMLLEFRRKEIRQRMQCTPISTQVQNLQLLFGFLLMGTVFWAVCVLVTAGVSGAAFFKDSNRAYYLLNSFLLMLVSLAVAFFIGSIVKNGKSAQAAVNGLVNVISLGMCFLCGVFVSMDLMDETVRKGARFLPVYWYEVNNTLLAEHTSLNAAQMQQLLEGYGLLVLFAAALVGAGMVISKMREKES